MREDKAQENFTDPDSRIMKRAGGGFDPAYNAQTAMDETAHIIVAAELDNTAPDANWLLPMIQAVGDNLGELPELGLADAGYRSEDNLKNAPIEVVVALVRAELKLLCMALNLCRMAAMVDLRVAGAVTPSASTALANRLRACTASFTAAKRAGLATPLRRSRAVLLPRRLLDPVGALP